MEKDNLTWPDLEKYQWYKTGYHEVIYNLIAIRNKTKSSEEFGNKVSGYIDGLCDYKDMQLNFERIKENI